MPTGAICYITWLCSAKKKDWPFRVELDTFWTDEEFAALLGEQPYTGLTDENAVIEPPETNIAHGDLFALGRHRVLCGNATVAADMERLLARRTPVLCQNSALLK